MVDSRICDDDDKVEQSILERKGGDLRASYAESQKTKTKSFLDL